MSDLALITQRAARDGVPAAAVERDYVLAHAVAAIGASDKSGSIVLKGGTALRLCYFMDYRYSADLDFSMAGAPIENAYAAIDAALAAAAGAIEGLSLTDGNPIRIEYRGPLGRRRFLKLDVTSDELVISKAPVHLLNRWSDVPRPATIAAYSINEIAGEKLRCVMQRLQCRDLYDLWFLLEQADIDWVEAVGIFKRKASHRNLDPNGFAASYRSRLRQYRHRWTSELEVHLPGQIPHFEHVERAVSRRLRSVSLL